MSIFIQVSCFMFFVFFCHTKSFSTQSPITLDQNHTLSTSEKAQAEFLTRIEKTASSSSVKEKDPDASNVTPIGCMGDYAALVNKNINE